MYIYIHIYIHAYIRMYVYIYIYILRVCEIQKFELNSNVF